MHFFQNEEWLVNILLYSIWVIAATILVLVGVLIIWRLFKDYRQKRAQKREKKLTRLIYSYLDKRVSKEELKNHFKSKPSEIPVFVEICINLLEDLDGSLEEKILQLFYLERIQKIYIKKLQSRDEAKISEALSFFRFQSSLNEDQIKLIESYLSGDNAEIVFAAALALIKAGDLDTQYRMLKVTCQSDRLSKIAILELLIVFLELGEPNGTIRGDVMIKLIKNKELSQRNRFMIVKSLGELEFMHQALPLYIYLTGILENKSEIDTDFVGSLIETLGKLQYTKILSQIERLITSTNADLKIYCVKALGALGGEKSINLLQQLFYDDHLDVQFEAMIQLLKVGEEALVELAGSPEKNYPAIGKSTIQELREIKDYRYG
jgi:HEAT repeat protein